MSNNHSTIIFLMNVPEFLTKLKVFQNQLIKFIENKENTDENYQSILNILFDQQIINDIYVFKLTLHLIVNISNNRHRNLNFFDKIDQILRFLKNKISERMSNSEIFTIFKSSKRLLLFLIEEEIIKVDEYIVKNMTLNDFVDKNYPEYFAPEIKPFITEQFINTYKANNRIVEKPKWIKFVSKELPENFNEKRKQAENDSFICRLIREDNVKEFVKHITPIDLTFNSLISPSIFETNSFLIKSEHVTLLEYALFFGSMKIINYFIGKGAELIHNLFFYAIHSQNINLIQKFEEYEEPYHQLRLELIRCHHNNLVNFFENNYSFYENEDIVFYESIKSYNFAYIKSSFINENYLHLFCEFDYISFVEFLLNEKKVDVNNTDIIYVFNHVQYSFFPISFNNKNRMKFIFIYFFRTPLYLAVKEENIELIKLLLSYENLNIIKATTVLLNFSISFNYLFDGIL